jgi:glycosyltransferase involved in cell wall biosynthesis
MPNKELEVSVVLPCLNEAEGIGTCIRKIQTVFKRENIDGEIIVVDNGSIDNSPRIAESLGAKLVYQTVRGYGAAYQLGIKTAQGKYIVIGDADDSYDFLEIPKFLQLLREGFDLVIGSRFKGKITKKAMPWTHRYIGNPILSGFLNIFFKAHISDIHCGMRAFRKKAYIKMRLNTTGMEFASEMIVGALRSKLKIQEVPITYYPRKGKSKLESLPDAWRHIRFMLLFSPTYLFLLPGVTLFIIGLAILFVLLPGPLKIGPHAFDIHMMVFGSLAAIFGFQIINIGLFAKTYALSQRFILEDKIFEGFIEGFNLEKGIITGLILFIIGLSVNVYIIYQWISAHFGTLDMIRPALFALTSMLLGAQTIFSSFFLSLLKIKQNQQK